MMKAQDRQKQLSSAEETIDAGHTGMWFELLQALCGYNDEYVDFVTRWFADIIQNPARNPGIAIGISGPQGIGKNSLVSPIGQLLGQGFSDQITMEHVIGQFNGPIAAKLLCVLDEATWGGSHKEAQTIKRTITAEKDLINPKGFGHYSLPCYRRMMFLSNEAFYLRVDKDDRRILPLEPDHSTINKGNVDFWKKFKAFQESGEMAQALLHMLSNIELDGWNPQEAFKKLRIVTGRALVESAKEPWEHWIDEVVESGVISYPNDGHLDDISTVEIAGKRIEMKDLQDAFLYWSKLNGSHTEWMHYKFRTLRTDIFGDSKPSNGKRYHNMPAHEEMKRLLAAKTGWQYDKTAQPKSDAKHPLIVME